MIYYFHLLSFLLRALNRMMFIFNVDENPMSISLKCGMVIITKLEYLDSINEIYQLMEGTNSICIILG
jgi:hypothetical protein